MSLKVKLIPIREIYFNQSNGFRVLGCKSVEGDVVLNKYGNFTLSGTNLSTLDVGEEYELEIREDNRSKYPASYILVGFSGIDVNENGIAIKPEQEMIVLKHICDGNQPKYIHEAYPNFVQLVLDGREEEIDYKKIYNVGPVRFEEYINKVKGYFNTIQFLPIINDWGIEKDKDIEQIIKVFATPEELKQKLETSPYQVFFDLLNYSFDKSDKFVLSKRPDLIDSKERCEFACLEILRENELEGDTRIYTELLEDLAKDKTPECAQYVNEVIKTSERIFYDEEKQYSSNKDTYNAEMNIAKNIKDRLQHEDNLCMNIDNFTTIDGFQCTDEQKQILELANRYKVCMLRGYGGSGKSTVMKSLVLMLEAHHKSYRQLAPTGKAAKRLRETTGRPASTIHMLLACCDDMNDDFVILDEFSMVGVHLLSLLFNVCSKDTRFIFVCDEAQLASISCGNVTQDIIDSGIVPTATLTKIFRYGTSGLATIATDTRNGSLGPRQNSTFTDYQFIPINDKPIKQIFDSYQNLLDKYNKDDIMILSPFNKGPAGTVAINKAIQSRYNPNPDTKAIRKISSGEEIMFKIGDKVINTHNEYNMPCFLTDDDGSLVESIDKTISVMNGDIGYVRTIKETDKGIIMAVEFDTGMAQVYGAYMNNLLLGYAISIHKCVTADTLVLSSQGIKTIEEVVKNKNEQLKLFNGNKFEQPCNYYKNSNMPCKSIVTKSGVSLTGTLNHGVTVMTKDGLKRKNLEEIKINDYVVIAKNTKVYGNVVDISNFYVDRSDNRQLSTITIPNKLNEEIGEFLGMMVADGTVFKRGFRLAKRNKEMVDKFTYYVRKYFNAPLREFFFVDKNKGVQGAYYSEVSTTQVAQWLTNLGGLSPKDKYVPDIILSAPKSIQCAFLRGLFEDGTVNIKKEKFDHIEFATESKKCSQQVQTMLFNMGIINIRKKYKKNLYTIYIYRESAVKFYKQISFISENKVDKLKKCLKVPKHTCSNIVFPYGIKFCKEIIKDYPSVKLDKAVLNTLSNKTTMTINMMNRFLKCFANNNIQDERISYLVNLSSNFYFDQVAEIEDTQKETYCVEMPKTHQFVQNSICGWNCQGSEAKAVIVITSPQHKRMLSSNLLYVGDSRAKEQLIEIGDIKAIQEGLKRHENKERETWLCELLKEEQYDSNQM